MKQVLILGVTALVLFSVSAVGSWKWAWGRIPTVAGDKADSSSKPSVHDSIQGEHKTSSGSPSHGKSVKSDKSAKEGSRGPVASAKRRPVDARQGIPGKPSTFESETKVEETNTDTQSPRGGVRPAYVAGVDETVQIATNLRDRLNLVKEREAEFTERQKQLEFIFEDIRGERSAIDELRKQVDAELKAVEARVGSAESYQADLNNREQSLRERISEVQNEEMVNIKKIAGMYDNIAPEEGARILLELANNGKLDTATQVLGSMKDRQAAKILAEMSDPSVGAQLLERIRATKKPATVPKK